MRVVNFSSDNYERFIAIGTDGIWDNIAPEDLTDIVLANPEIGTSSEIIVNKARDMCSFDKIPMDDMTLVISHLRQDR